MGHPPDAREIKIPTLSQEREKAWGTLVWTLSSDDRDGRDGRDASSSIATAPSCSPSRIRESLCGFRLGTGPRRDSRCRPSCDNPCGFYRRPGPERSRLEVQAWP